LQMDYIFPKFGDREFGLNAPIGTLLNLNPICIIFLAPVIGAMTQRFAAYRIVIIGGTDCPLCRLIFFLSSPRVAPLSESAACQWFLHHYLGLRGATNPYYIMAILYLIVYSVGEAFYSPRVYEYAASIAPPGQEASYGSLAYLPFLFGKLLVGTGG